MTRRIPAAALALAALALATAQPVRATQIEPMAGATIDLPAMHGVAYYTEEPDGYRVVATVTHGPSGATIRVVSVLSAGERVLLEVPRGPGEPAESVEIVRIGDSLHVRPAGGMLEARID